jgi:hypothetical protein
MNMKYLFDIDPTKMIEVHKLTNDKYSQLCKDKLNDEITKIQKMYSSSLVDLAQIQLR